VNYREGFCVVVQIKSFNIYLEIKYVMVLTILKCANCSKNIQT